MLYTGRGDDGTTKTFACDQRISKSSAVAEALGALDETNSFLGLCKVTAQEVAHSIDGKQVAAIVHDIQQSLFIIQAEVAGAGKSVAREKVTGLEAVVAAAEKELPPIKTFFISGGSELAALFDTARTIARRAERRVVALVAEGELSVSPETLAYLNRLSSLLYALARLANHQAGISEESPSYI